MLGEYLVWREKIDKIEGQVLVTRIRVDINLLEPAQELDHGKNVLLDPELESWKNIFENRVRIYM